MPRNSACRPAFRKTTETLFLGFELLYTLHKLATANQFTALRATSPDPEEVMVEFFSNL